MRTIRPLAILAIASLLGAVPALAGSIDFTDADTWGPVPFSTDGVDGKYSFTADGITISSHGGRMTFNDSDNGGCLAGKGSAHGLECEGDGIGIGDDEVTGKWHQVLTVDFSAIASGVDILGVQILDLFPDEGRWGQDEKVLISATGTSGWHPFDSAGGPGGYLSISLAGMPEFTNVTTLYFKAGKDCYSDFALAGVDYEPVPEPGTLTLLGIGLTGLALRARGRGRRKGR